MVQRGERGSYFYWPLGSLNIRVCNSHKINKQSKMTELIPYFAGLITLLFSAGILLALSKFRSDK